jgi:hypothetical protein
MAITGLGADRLDIIDPAARRHTAVAGDCSPPRLRWLAHQPSRFISDRVRSLQQDCVGRVLVTTRHRLTDMAEARQLTKPNFSIGYSHRKFRANRADIGA